MKNKTLYFVGILIVMVLVVFGIKSFSNKSEAPQTIKDVTESMVKETIKGSGKYNIDVTASTLEWEGRKLIIKNWTDRGVVSAKSGNLTIDNDKITSGEVVVDMSTIGAKSTGKGDSEDKLSGHLKSPDFFDVAKFPTAKFTLKSATLSSEENKYTVKGDMTIRDVTKSIEFPAMIYTVEGKVYFDALLTIDRSLYGVKFGSTTFFSDLGDKAVDNNFNLKLRVIATK